MKLYLMMLIGVACGYQTISAAATNKDKLLAAVTGLDLRAVKKFLRRLGPLEEQEKKEIFLAAEKNIESCQKKVSIFKSAPDAAKCIGGTVVCSLGLLTVYSGLRAFARNHSYIYLSSVASFFSLYGFYKAYSGFTCETAASRLRQAREIGKEIKNAQVNNQNDIPKG